MEVKQEVIATTTHKPKVTQNKNMMAGILGKIKKTNKNQSKHSRKNSLKVGPALNQSASENMQPHNFGDGINLKRQNQKPLNTSLMDQGISYSQATRVASLGKPKPNIMVDAPFYELPEQTLSHTVKAQKTAGQSYIFQTFDQREGSGSLSPKSAIKAKTFSNKKNENKLPKIKNNQTNINPSTKIQGHLPPSAANLSTHNKTQKIAKAYAPHTFSASKNSHINYMKNYVTNQILINSNHTGSAPQILPHENIQNITHNASTLLKIADESLAILDKEIRKQGIHPLTAAQKQKFIAMNQTANRTVSPRHHHRQFSGDHSALELINANSPAATTATVLNENIVSSNKKQNLTEGMPSGEIQLRNPNNNSQNPMNLAFQNSFNTNLVVQNSHLNILDLQNLLQKLKDNEQKIQNENKSSIVYQFIMECMNELKESVIHKDFQALVNLLQKMIENLFTKTKNKQKSNKKQQQINTDKLNQQIKNIEQQLFKTKTELDTLTLDKQFLEDQINLADTKLDLLRNERREFEQKYLETLQELERTKTNLSKNTNIMQNDDIKAAIAREQNREGEDDMLSNLQKLADQNQSLNNENKLLHESLDYAKNKENKLMYLIFKMHQRGYPVNQIYEDEVKPISTSRFSNQQLDSIQKHLGQGPGLTDQDLMNDLKGESYIEFESQASYEDMNLVKVVPKPKPDFVPSLILEGLPEYVSSDEEDQNAQPPMDDVQYAALQGQKNKNKSF